MNEYPHSVHSDRGAEELGAAASEEIRSIEYGNPLFVTDSEPSSPSPPQSERRHDDSRELRSNGSALEVHLPPVRQRWTYKSFPDEWKVRKILREIIAGPDGIIKYEVEFADGGTDTVSGFVIHFPHLFSDT